MKILSLSIILMEMLSCILAISYDKKTVLNAASYTIGEPLEVSKAFRRVDELLGSSPAAAATESGSLRQKLQRIAETVELTSQEGDEVSQAVEILEGLDTVSTWCDLDGYRALMRAYLSATDDTLEATLDPSSPTSEIVIEALERHGQACRAQYSLMFPQVEQDMEPEERVYAGKVDRLLSSDMLDLLFPEEDLKTRVRAIDIVPDRLVASVSRDLFMSKLNDSAKRTADRINLQRDLSEKDATRHLIEPCKSYVENYGDIFLPARLDLAMNEEKIWQVNPTKNQKFNEAWIKFRVCSALISDPQETLNLINQKLRRD